jgi:hypothetical protein
MLSVKANYVYVSCGATSLARRMIIRSRIKLVNHFSHSSHFAATRSTR